MMTPPHAPFRLAALAAIALLLAGPAAAHAILVDSQPEIAGSAPAGHVALRLRYNSRIDHARSRLTLTRPDRTRIVLPTGADDPVDVLTAAADLDPGVYVLRWQVLAIDGHITRGDVPFTVTPAGTPLATLPVRPGG